MLSPAAETFRVECSLHFVGSLTGLYLGMVLTAGIPALLTPLVAYWIQQTSP